MFLKKFIPKNKLFLIAGFLIVFAIGGTGWRFFVLNTKKTSVKGVTVHSISTVSVTQSPASDLTPVPTLIKEQISKKTNLTPTPTSAANTTNTVSSNNTQASASNNNQSNNAFSETTSTPQQPAATSTSANQPTTAVASTATPIPPQPSPTVIVVVHPGNSGGASASVQVGGYQYIYVTPTPNTGPFEASFSFTDSNGSARIVANKPIKSCEGIQKDPNPPTPAADSTIIGQVPSVNVSPMRWACGDYGCGYICELQFAPANTASFNWPTGAKVVSEMDETKTFGYW